MEAKNLRDMLDYVEEYDIKEWQLSQVIRNSFWISKGSIWEALGIPVNNKFRVWTRQIREIDTAPSKEIYPRSKFFGPDARVLTLKFKEEDYDSNITFIMALINLTDEIIADGYLPLDQYEHTNVKIFWNGDLESIAKPTYFRHMKWVRVFQNLSEPVKETRSLWNDRMIHLKALIGSWYLYELGIPCSVPRTKRCPFPLIRQPNPYIWKKTIHPLISNTDFSLALSL